MRSRYVCAPIVNMPKSTKIDPRARAPRRQVNSTASGSAQPPAWIKPQLTRLVEEAPEGTDWLHEIKYDATGCTRGSMGPRSSCSPEPAWKVTTQADPLGQASECRPSESLGRFTKCSLALWRGWSGQVQESLKLVNLSSVLISFLISARVVGWARRKAISQMTLWPSSPHAQAALLIGKSATSASRMWRMLLLRSQAFFQGALLIAMTGDGYREAGIQMADDGLSLNAW